jgi:hypothetical protein
MEFEKREKETKVSQKMEVLSYLKLPFRKRNVYCYLCTPLCTILSIFAGLLLAIAIAAILIAVMVKNKSTTRSMTSECSFLFVSLLYASKSILIISNCDYVHRINYDIFFISNFVIIDNL